MQKVSCADYKKFLVDNAKLSMQYVMMIESNLNKIATESSFWKKFTNRSKIKMMISIRDSMKKLMSSYATSAIYMDILVDDGIYSVEVEDNSEYFSKSTHPTNMFKVLMDYLEPNNV